MRILDVTTSLLTSLGRLGQGHAVGAIGRRPEKPLILYEYEACPFCRKVREALTALDLQADIRPCPRGGERFRPDVIAQGGIEAVLEGMRAHPDAVGLQICAVGTLKIIAEVDAEARMKVLDAGALIEIANAVKMLESQKDIGAEN